ncbi:1,4-dihydroxy-2-naphthoate octaprenyltransferase [Neotamlana laminarinivorans]|uniref:1,4-dihydroxy-2-naphthoate octaprenyltransferase n=1 Tax=Neotamlana laminarinivorans TaxID=2883124 RepID=A0A9X1HX78_9FLAO|nr:1,4-dihydroxy-2-naphthoate octaprenyltransferase [Tamlana laminarinivorans]MCB4797575.1 1,4-dihydroxy-2-naphthoate octaprenyltransferase [Tamlana laminarinivorans]
MNKFSVWISAMRLRTLPLSVSGIILASCLAQYKGVFNWSICILAILTTLSFQILSNFANDYGDGVKGTDNAERIGPERAIQSGKITPKQLFNAIKINIVVALLLAIALIYIAFGSQYILLSVLFLVLGVASIIAAMKYTVGENAYGYRAMGDIFVFIFFGLISVLGCYALFAKNLDFIAVLPAFVVGLLSTGVLNLNNMRDRIPDEKVNKITLAVKLGGQKAKWYHYTLIGMALGLALIFGIIYYKNPLSLIFLIAFIPIIKHVLTVVKNTEPAQLDPELKKLALSTVLLAILMGVGQLF